MSLGSIISNTEIQASRLETLKPLGTLLQTKGIKNNSEQELYFPVKPIRYFVLDFLSRKQMT